MNLKQLTREKKIGSRSRITANEFKNKKTISDVVYILDRLLFTKVIKTCLQTLSSLSCT